MMSKKKWSRSSPDTVELLFTAVDEDDRVNENTSLPDNISLRCSAEEIYHCYSLCLQFWEDGFSRRELLQLVNTLYDGGKLSEAERMQYKFIRARYKHLRFAQRLYSKNHRSDTLFSHTTVVLGHFQDAFRNENKRNIRRYGAALRILLSTPVWTIVHYNLRRTRLDHEQGFTTYRQQKIRGLQQMIKKSALTGDEFHEVRKVISQQVSFYDTVRSLDPGNRDAFEISRFLSNINGLMGDRHDVMVSDKLAGINSYDAPVSLDENIRQPLELLIARYPV